MNDTASHPNPPPDDPTRTVDIEVRYAETDQMGVVHHSNYLVWFELARTALCHDTGWHYAEIEAAGHYLVVTGTETRHIRGAKYGDIVQVACRLDRMSSRGLRFAYRVTRGDELLARGATEHIWVAIRNGRPCRIPETLRAPFERLLDRRPLSPARNS